MICQYLLQVSQTYLLWEICCNSCRFDWERKMFRYPSVVYNEIVNIKHKLWIRPWFWLINKIQFVADKKDETKLNYLLCSRDLCLCVWYWKLQSQRLPYQLLHHLLLPASGLHPADVRGDAAQAVEDLLLQCFKVKRKYFWKKYKKDKKLKVVQLLLMSLNCDKVFEQENNNFEMRVVDLDCTFSSQSF